MLPTQGLGPVSHWKWHTLNDPPVLQQVMIDTQMAHKDPNIMNLDPSRSGKTRHDDEEMLAIEFDNFIKEKSKKMSQTFKPFQITMKALKMNEQFSLKVLDQATVYLVFRAGTTNLKLNIGMVLDPREIVDTETSDLGDVSNNMDKLPARTDSLARLQKSIAHAQHYDRSLTERDRRIRRSVPRGSADALTAAASCPLRPDPSGFTTPADSYCKCSRRPFSGNSYQDDPSCYVGSFPKDFSYGPFEQNGDGDSTSLQEDHKPRILLMGLRRSGKSSIQKVVFHKMSPNETLFLESTNKIVKDDINNSSFVQFQIWDFPGQIDFFDPTFDSDTIFGGCGALVFVIDAQDDYQEALDRLHQTVTKAYRVNEHIKFEVFIHKMESQRDIHHRATEDLAEAGLEHVHLSFHLTSIYDHSIFEAFSKVVQKLIPQLPTLENLLNILISNSGIEKAFLFDVVSKIYIATDSSPVDMQSYELCCDMIDVVIDISCIYGLILLIYIATDSSPVDMQSYELCCDMIDVVIDISCIYGLILLIYIATDSSPVDMQSYELCCDMIDVLNNGTVLYLREVNKFLALVCILREENFQKQVFELRNKCQNAVAAERTRAGSPEPLANGAADSAGAYDESAAGRPLLP
ncbi:Ras-related GTP-binding protein [Operophtera brumata]|uniref:Ras-related GTP-binding protein n=1 Tax=Operophtera brumata TaxID=104452 RepID=A0A0L7LEN7_OPEBR|nr:Ras-related GTP-binding protein [Operophtera brumata]